MGPTSCRQFYRVEQLLSCGKLWYHLGRNVIMWDQMFPGGANVIMCRKCYNLKDYFIMWDQILSCGANIVMRKLMLSCGILCYHMRQTLIMRNQLFS